MRAGPRSAIGPPILPVMPERLPLPGPSYLREIEVRAAGPGVRAGMAVPTTTDDGWWLAVLWLADDEGVVSFRSLAAKGGPPPEPPVARLGPLLAGGLSGLILEEDGHLDIRLAPVVAADDPSRPWRSPAALRAAIKFEPMRAATMRPNELAESVLVAFGRAIAAIARR